MEDVSFDRRIIKRIRKVLDNENWLSFCSSFLYSFFYKVAMHMQSISVLDKIWFGVCFVYNAMDLPTAR
jgi:hypothetical protein